MDRRIAIALILLLVIALARYVAVSFFVHPFADDFSYAVAGMHNDLLPRLADEYRFWNGRWFSNILVLRGPLVLGMEKGLWLYRIVPIALMALTWGGFYALLRVWVDAWAMPRGTLVIGASTLLLLYLQLMPDISEGIYWYTGAVSYQLPGALMLFLAAAWMRLLDSAKSKRPRQLVLVILLAVIICGCSELHMVYMVLFHAALLLKPKSQMFHGKKYVAIVLPFVVAAALVMYMAPGNEGRALQFPERHDLVRTVLWGGLQTGRFVIAWMCSPAMLLAALLYLSMCPWLNRRASLLALVVRIRPWVFALFMGAVVFISMALPYWTTGLLGQHRTVNATLLFFLPCYLLLLTLLWWHGLRGFASRLEPYRLHLCALLAVVVYATGSGGRVTADLFGGRMTAFDVELNARYGSIESAAAKGSTRKVLPILQNRPRSLRYLDGTPDPEHWINRSIAQYFAADEMRIAIGTAPLPPTGPPGPR